MGVFTVFFDVSYMAYVPGLVGPDRMLEANSRLQVTWSAAQTVGPGLGGVLVQAVGAARAVLIDALSFVVVERRAAVDPPRRGRPVGGRSAATSSPRWARDCATSSASRALRAQLLCLTAAGVFAHAYEAPLYVFAYERLHLSPGRARPDAGIAGARAR